MSIKKFIESKKSKIANETVDAVETKVEKQPTNSLANYFSKSVPSADLAETITKLGESIAAGLKDKTNPNNSNRANIADKLEVAHVGENTISENLKEKIIDKILPNNYLSKVKNMHGLINNIGVRLALTSKYPDLVSFLSKQKDQIIMRSTRPIMGKPINSERLDESGIGYLTTIDAHESEVAIEKIVKGNIELDSKIIKVLTPEQLVELATSQLTKPEHLEKVNKLSSVTEKLKLLQSVINKLNEVTSLEFNNLATKVFGDSSPFYTDETSFDNSEEKVESTALNDSEEMDLFGDDVVEELFVDVSPSTSSDRIHIQTNVENVIRWLSQNGAKYVKKYSAYSLKKSSEINFREFMEDDGNGAIRFTDKLRINCELDLGSIISDGTNKWRIVELKSSDPLGEDLRQKYKLRLPSHTANGLKIQLALVSDSSLIKMFKNTDIKYLENEFNINLTNKDTLIQKYGVGNNTIPNAINGAGKFVNTQYSPSIIQIGDMYLESAGQFIEIKSIDKSGNSLDDNGVVVSFTTKNRDDDNVYKLTLREFKETFCVKLNNEKEVLENVLGTEYSEISSNISSEYTSVVDVDSSIVDGSSISTLDVSNQETDEELGEGILILSKDTFITKDGTVKVGHINKMTGQIYVADSTKNQGEGVFELMSVQRIEREYGVQILNKSEFENNIGSPIDLNLDQVFVIDTKDGKNSYLVDKPRIVANQIRIPFSNTLHSAIKEIDDFENYFGTKITNIENIKTDLKFRDISEEENKSIDLYVGKVIDDLPDGRTAKIINIDSENDPHVISVKYEQQIKNWYPIFSKTDYTVNEFEKVFNCKVRFVESLTDNVSSDNQSNAAQFTPAKDIVNLDDYYISILSNPELENSIILNGKALNSISDTVDELGGVYSPTLGGIVISGETQVRKMLEKLAVVQAGGITLAAGDAGLADKIKSYNVSQVESLEENEVETARVNADTNETLNDHSTMQDIVSDGSIGVFASTELASIPNEDENSKFTLDTIFEIFDEGRSYLLENGLQTSPFPKKAVRETTQFKHVSAWLIEAGKLAGINDSELNELETKTQTDQDIDLVFRAVSQQCWRSETEIDKKYHLKTKAEQEEEDRRIQAEYREEILLRAAERQNILNSPEMIERRNEVHKVKKLIEEVISKAGKPLVFDESAPTHQETLMTSNQIVTQSKNQIDRDSKSPEESTVPSIHLDQSNSILETPAVAGGFFMLLKDGKPLVHGDGSMFSMQALHSLAKSNSAMLVWSENPIEGSVELVAKDSETNEINVVDPAMPDYSNDHVTDDNFTSIDESIKGYSSVIERIGRQISDINNEAANYNASLIMASKRLPLDENPYAKLASIADSQTAHELEQSDMPDEHSYDEFTTMQEWDLVMSSVEKLPDVIEPESQLSIISGVFKTVEGEAKTTIQKLVDKIDNPLIANLRMAHHSDHIFLKYEVSGKNIPIYRLCLVSGVMEISQLPETVTESAMVSLKDVMNNLQDGIIERQDSSQKTNYHRAPTQSM